jgi:hypothetical protein
MSGKQLIYAEGDLKLFLTTANYLFHSLHIVTERGRLPRIREVVIWKFH